MLGDQPLSVDSSIQNWASGQGGWIADNLGRALLLPNDTHYFAKGIGKAISLRLRWHTIAVSSKSFPFFTYLPIISIFAFNLVSNNFN